MSASEMKCFLHVLPFLIYEFIIENENDTETDCVWNFLLCFLKIINIIESKSFSTEKINNLRLLVENHHQMFVHIFNSNLKPKHHFLLHYPDIIEQSGPIIHLWSMRGEAKHKELKKYSNSISSRVNLPYSILFKQQIKFSYRVFSARGFKDELKFGPVVKNNSIISTGLGLEIASEQINKIIK